VGARQRSLGRVAGHQFGQHAVAAGARPDHLPAAACQQLACDRVGPHERGSLRIDDAKPAEQHLGAVGAAGHAAAGQFQVEGGQRVELAGQAGRLHRLGDQPLRQQLWRGEQRCHGHGGDRADAEATQQRDGDDNQRTPIRGGEGLQSLQMTGCGGARDQGRRGLAARGRGGNGSVSCCRPERAPLQSGRLQPVH